MRTSVRLILSVLLTVGVGPLAAQSAPPLSRPATMPARAIPDPIELPGGFKRALERGTRSTEGTPGAAYWQQWSRYRLSARLDTARKELAGTARIVYLNRSPDTLRIVGVHLYQNLHAPGVVRNGSEEVNGGVRLARVASTGVSLAEQPSLQQLSRGETAGYVVNGTVMVLRPPQPLLPGDSTTLEFDWTFTIPQSGSGRMGHSQENVYHIAYWYPQMAVYDDVSGWHLDPYLGNAEFYSGFGDYEVTIDAPAGWIVSATGTLQNGGEVYSDSVAARLRRAESSDSVVRVLAESDLGPGRATRTSATGRLVWRFRADSVRDVAFSATSRSVWDAARSAVGDRDGDGAVDYTRVDALYRPAVAPRWHRMWRYVQHAVGAISRHTKIPYPWSHMTAVEGSDIIGGGMEYPMMTLIGHYNNAGDTALYATTTHEVGHMWVPMIVSVDEKRYGWMDEGTTNFNENVVKEDFLPGMNHHIPDQDIYLNTARNENEGAVMTWTDYHYPGRFVVMIYQKPATVLAALRGLLGDDVFYRAYDRYLSAWAYKHPQPYDFFNVFEAASGKDLDWFWHTWYYQTWTLDQAIADVKPGSAGTRIVIRDEGNAPMPVRLAVTHADGKVTRHEIPVDRWLAGARTAEITVRGARATRVEIDPERIFPDIDTTDNRWAR